ncbi:hypothetical protein [Paenarthrobacter sp. CM16]|nr:hypothetical protein [Paenarthrobacter sp. CM16]
MVLGFTRLDEMDRVNDLASRLVKQTRKGKPVWVPATETEVKDSSSNST